MLSPKKNREIALKMAKEEWSKMPDDIPKEYLNASGCTYWAKSQWGSFNDFYLTFIVSCSVCNKSDVYLRKLTNYSVVGSYDDYDETEYCIIKERKWFCKNHNRTIKKETEKELKSLRKKC